MAQVAAMSAEIKELRGLQRRLELRQLEPIDLPKLKAFLAGLIARTEAAGLDRVDFDLDLPDFRLRH